MVIYTEKSDAGRGARALLFGLWRQKPSKLATTFQHHVDRGSPYTASVRFTAPISRDPIQPAHDPYADRADSVALARFASSRNNAAHSYRGFGSHFDIHLI